MWPFDSKASGKKKALVVDDDAVIRALIGDLLEAEGFEVLDAANGKDAVEIARAQRPALIVMDINMPVMTGPEALDRMRRDPLTKDIPVVMCSSEDTMDSVDKCLTLGANDYVVKPFEMARLKAKLAPFLK
ncbi:MAG: response regulator [Elusimicrobiota bacterium]